MAILILKTVTWTVLPQIFPRYQVVAQVWVRLDAAVNYRDCDTLALADDVRLSHF